MVENIDRPERRMIPPPPGDFNMQLFRAEKGPGDNQLNTKLTIP
jgi:hypothetical protein